MLINLTFDEKSQDLVIGVLRQDDTEAGPPTTRYVAFSAKALRRMLMVSVQRQIISDEVQRRSGHVLADHYLDAALAMLGPEVR